MTLADALNVWLQIYWPTLFANSFEDPYRVFQRSTTIYRKGSNNAVMQINEDEWKVRLYGTPRRPSANMWPDPMVEWHICNPADPGFLDKINDCLIRCCRGKDLR